MRIQLFGSSHQFYSSSDAMDAICREVLEGHLPTIAVKVHAAVGGCIAMCRQGMIRTTGIVTGTLTGIFAASFS